MKVLILFAQRQEQYNGQYAPECLAVMSEWDQESNPEYLENAKKDADASGEFEKTEIITLEVSEEAIMSRLRPNRLVVSATIHPEVTP